MTADVTSDADETNDTNYADDTDDSNDTDANDTNDASDNDDDDDSHRRPRLLRRSVARNRDCAALVKNPTCSCPFQSPLLVLFSILSSNQGTTLPIPLAGE